MHDVLTRSIDRRLLQTDSDLSLPAMIQSWKTFVRPATEDAVLVQRQSSIAWLRSRRTITRIIVAIAPFLCQITGSTVFEHERTRTDCDAF